MLAKSLWFELRSCWTGVVVWGWVLGSLAVPGWAQAPAAPAGKGAKPAVTAASPEPGLVLAIDTSRSLSREALQAGFEPMRRALLALPSTTKVGLLAFDDAPRWEIAYGASPSQVAEGLSALDPQGRFTLLNDALFTAGEALASGGVVVLATDGRDENSATTVEDIARRFEAQRVRVVAVGLGRNLDEKALRRLAMLSRGDYLGKAAAVESGKLVASLERHQAAIGAALAEEARKAAPPVARPAPATQAEPAGVAPATPNASPARGANPAAAGPAAAPSNTVLAFLPWALSGLLGFAFLTYVLLRQRAARRSVQAEVEEQRGREEALAADEADAAAIRVELAQVPPAMSRESPEVTVDTAVMQRISLEERLDRTRVLSSMVILRKPGEAPRSFMLDREKAFAVGRDKEKNTLAIPDPSISSQHFKIVPRGGIYYFVDLESTNGSYVGGRRVRAKRLRSGDVIRAGQVDFEFQSYSEG